MFGFYFDRYYFILVIPAMLLALWAQARVSATFGRYARVATRRGYTGEAAARRILDLNGLQAVQIRHVRGNLTDHFDPRTNVVNLSDGVFGSTSVAAVGVAAHEVGHAIQHATGYFPIRVRAAIVPVTNLGSKLAVPLILMGLVFDKPPVIQIGIVLFSLMALFQLVTLPVEYNASGRALATLEQTEMLDGQEMKGAKKVLGAAALTYVAALIVAVAQLLRMVLLVGNRRRRD